MTDILVALFTLEQHGPAFQPCLQNANFVPQSLGPFKACMFETQVLLSPSPHSSFLLLNLDTWFGPLCSGMRLRPRTVSANTQFFQAAGGARHWPHFLAYL